MLTKELLVVTKDGILTTVSKADIQAERTARWQSTIKLRRIYRKVGKRMYSITQIEKALADIYGVDLDYDECYRGCEVGEMILTLPNSLVEQLDLITEAGQFSFKWDFGFAKVRVTRK